MATGPAPDPIATGIVGRDDGQMLRATSFVRSMRVATAF